VGTLLRGGTLVELEPASVEVGDLRVEHGVIVARGSKLEPVGDDEVVDCTGRLVLPGFVSGHHHLSATLLRGLERAEPGFVGEQQALERLEDALDGDEVEAAAAAGGLEGLQSGTTTVFNHHASPRAVSGSLSRVAHGLHEVGLRAVLAWEVSDRSGAMVREESLEECLSFAARARGRLRGAVGLGHLHSLSDDGLSFARTAVQDKQVLALVNLAEDPREEKQSLARFGKSPVERLVEAGLVGQRVVLGQGVHLSWPDLSRLISEGTWMVHAPRSNMASQTGAATPSKFGVRACLGTDVMPLDVLAEGQLAWLKARHVGQPIDVLRFFANGHRLASEAFGVTLGPLREGAIADLVVYDYQPPTVLDAKTLPAHVLFGLASHQVESVMVDGLWRLWRRRPLAVDIAQVMARAREASSAAWARIPR
jgi:cytosine/adenosine deaminase-related metal-dependent hydrolase